MLSGKGEAGSEHCSLSPCGILETGHLGAGWAFGFPSIPQSVCEASESCSLLVGKSRPSSLSHPRKPPPTQPEGGCFSLVLAISWATESLSEMRAAAAAERRMREARWSCTRLQLECRELLLLQIMSGLRMKNTLTTRVVLESGDSVAATVPAALCFLRHLLFGGLSPKPQREVAACSTRQIGASATEARARSRRSGCRPGWPTVGRAHSLAGTRGSRRPRLCMKRPLQKEQVTLLLRELG